MDAEQSALNVSTIETTGGVDGHGKLAFRQQNKNIKKLQCGCFFRSPLAHGWQNSSACFETEQHTIIKNIR